LPEKNISVRDSLDPLAAQQLHTARMDEATGAIPYATSHDLYSQRMARLACDAAKIKVSIGCFN
jgi:hypothetical protein